MTPEKRLFGHSIKNGPLPPYPAEITTFEHTCSSAPCVVTHVNVPSIYPSNEAWDWVQGLVNFYIDGEVTPSISVTLLELAGEAHFNAAGDNAQTGSEGTTDGSPWGIAMMGRTAKSGGVYSTVRVPFAKSLRTSIVAPKSYKNNSTFWFVIRGLEAHPVVLGDLTLPDEARLRLYRLPPAPVSPMQLLTLAEAPAGVSGALLRVHLDSSGPDFGYLEACMRFFPDGAKDDQPLFLSSGAEDYFLGSSYFDEGMFKTPNGGLTFFNRTTSSVGAYRTHDRDPVLWHNGMRLVFRCNEQTQGCGALDSCPNQWCGTNRTGARAADKPSEASHSPKTPKGSSSDLKETYEYSTLVWAYEWPMAPNQAIPARVSDGINPLTGSAAGPEGGGEGEGEGEAAALRLRLRQTQARLDQAEAKLDRLEKLYLDMLRRMDALAA